MPTKYVAPPVPQQLEEIRAALSLAETADHQTVLNAIRHLQRWTKVGQLYRTWLGEPIRPNRAALLNALDVARGNEI